MLLPLEKSKDTFIYLKTELLTKLENIEKSAVRNELKHWIYKHYFLPSVRFILTVHDLTKTEQTKLDAICTKYVKKMDRTSSLCNQPNITYEDRPWYNVYTTSTLHESKLLPHTQTLVKQGHLLSIAALEKSDAVWKSYMFDLKKGTMKFLLNACLDTLPTKTNLLQWGKTTSDLCKLCLDANQDLQGRRKETTHHMLKGCKDSLNQQRYTHGAMTIF